MSKLHNFVADELQNPELVQGARRGRGRRGRRGNPNVDNNPFDDGFAGFSEYTPKHRNPFKESARLEKKADRIRARQDIKEARDSRRRPSRRRF